MAYDTVTYKPKTSQVVMYTATAGLSTALTTGVDVVRLVADTNCFIQVNGTAVADGTSMLLPALQVEYIKVEAGDTISVVRVTVDGNLFLTEMAR